MVERITGIRIRPWPQPKVTNPRKPKNTVLKTSLVQKARGKVPRNV